MLQRLEDLVQTKEPIFVTGLFTAETAGLIAKSLKDENTVFFDPSESAMWQSALNSPNALKSMNGDSFSARFQHRYGYMPTLEVMRGYIAARLIAATVRSVSEEKLNNNEELLTAFTQVQRKNQ
jgi:ABC-type branched-subunit amino acid transport system substrate-binding protein